MARIIAALISIDFIVLLYFLLFAKEDLDTIFSVFSMLLFLEGCTLIIYNLGKYAITGVL